MSQPAKAQEPSMEEILASIRRIIADDDGKPGQAAAPAPKPVAAPEPELPPPPPPPEPESVANTQEDVDAMLADLEPPPAAVEPAPESEPEPPPAVPDVLMLTEEMTAPQQPPGFRTIEAGDDVVFSDAAARRPAADVGYDAGRGGLEDSANDRLLSNSTATAVDHAFNSLANTILGNNARTLEDLVKEMLRPMLKTWLDDNLPGLVERIVRAEIERVSRGR
ncbi:MAG: DUF2497 domain-containing protein [Pseudolabrys sp.]